MPIIVKDFKWRQTINTIVIQVPLKGTHQSKVEIFQSNRYIKASYPPFFFELFPFEPIESSKSKCTITATDIVFELFKESPNEWDKLELDLPKPEKNELKKLLIDEEHKRFQEELQEKSLKRGELKKKAVREQIVLDTKTRQRIESIKSTEKEKALGDLKSWNENIASAIPQSPKIVELNSSEDEEKVEKPISVASKPKICHQNIRYIKKCPNKNMPLPRKMATVSVEFTERELPTPSRESRLAEEQEWLRKQTEVRRSAGFVSEDLRPEEKNPVYLLAKGDEFLRNKNYLGAISAYSFGIKLSEKYPDLHRKRSEAHLAIGNLQRTIEDCSRALELMKPEVSANFLERVECIERRGRALFKIGMREAGFREIEIAYKMQPDKVELKNLLIEFMNELNNTEKEN